MSIMNNNEDQPTASQSGRSRRRGQGTTPVPKPTPSKRSSQTAAKATVPTPTTRRTRQTPARPDQSKDVVANPALPEIRTRSSYAYGSTNAPTLPQQLYARETMSLRQVAEQMDTDINRAQKNLGEHLSHQDELRTKPQDQTETQQGLYPTLAPVNAVTHNEAASQQDRHVTPASHATDLRKQQRTAAWASSLDESLEDILEESSLTGTPETRRTEPSSFPDIHIDHSYAYERGMRGPRVEPIARPPSRIVPAIQRVRHELSALWTEVRQILSYLWKELQNKFRRMYQATVTVVRALPQSTLLQALLKTLLILCLTGLFSASFCFVYRNYLCDPLSTSGFSATVQGFCGSCSNTGSIYNGWTWRGNTNITTDEFQANVHKLTTTLNELNKKINKLEIRLLQQIDTKHSTVQGEMDGLRRQQGDLTRLLENLRPTDPDASSSSPAGVVASPLISKMNFFAPANGAIINPRYTSPTRTRVPSLPVRVFLSIFGMKKYTVNGPTTALQPWHDVGDCWCASASAPGQDSLRLGVSVRDPMYPVELIVEHSPAGTTLTPDTAPKEMELWADVSHLSSNMYRELDIDGMRTDSDGVRDPFPSGPPNTYSNTNSANVHHNNVHAPTAKHSTDTATTQTASTPIWAKFASLEYDASQSSSPSSPNGGSGSGSIVSTRPHVQRFKLAVNQFGDLKYTAQHFVLRVRTSHGAEYSCLYRVRLHGVPVDASVDDGQSRSGGNKGRDTYARADGFGDTDGDGDDFF